MTASVPKSQQQSADGRNLENFLKIEDGSSQLVNRMESNRTCLGRYKRWIWGSVIALCCLAAAVAFIGTHREPTSGHGKDHSAFIAVRPMSQSSAKSPSASQAPVLQRPSFFSSSLARPQRLPQVLAQSADESSNEIEADAPEEDERVEFRSSGSLEDRIRQRTEQMEAARKANPDAQVIESDAQATADSSDRAERPQKERSAEWAVSSVNLPLLKDDNPNATIKSVEALVKQAKKMNTKKPEKLINRAAFPTAGLADDACLSPRWKSLGVWQGGVCSLYDATFSPITWLQIQRSIEVRLQRASADTDSAGIRFWRRQPVVSREEVERAARKAFASNARQFDGADGGLLHYKDAQSFNSDWVRSAKALGVKPKSLKRLFPRSRN
jgi:hypothetical protein